MATSNNAINPNQRTTGMGQRSSFVSLAEEIVSMNKNTVEITTKLNDIVASQNSAVSITLTDTQGNKSEYFMPTVGYLKNEIDKINSNIKRLSGIESSTNIIDGKTLKKVYTVDLNKEPYPITKLNQITKFSPVNNHFFESLLNPLLSVELDVSDKVTQNVNKIKSRRYIVKFERNSDFSLTEQGLISYNSFRNNFLNKTDIEINSFEKWYEEQSSIGILLDVVEPYDEQDFDLSVNEVNSHGLFTVIKTETDSINRKMWYHINTLNYYTKDGYDRSLSIGDYLILNKLNSTTKWQVKEISNESSNFRLILERIEGYDPVPIGVNVLSYYSDTTNQKKVKITVGFDEFCVLFVKPINTENNVVSTLWSKGTSFYTNDLILDSDNTTNLSEYYLSSVYDYGKVLKDMVLKKIPTEYAVTPNKVVLENDSFKVVQINKHITDTENTRVLKNLHSQKITSKAKLSQINNAIIEKNREINTTTYSSPSESNAEKNELSKLIDEQQKESKTLASIVSQISVKTKENKSDSKFRIRGFWNIPAPIFDGKTEPQHIIQFKVQYRYSAKSGEINPTEGFKLKQTTSIEKSDNTGRVVIDLPPTNTTTNTTTVPSGGSAAVILKGNIKVSKAVTDESTDKEKTAYFSNWVEFLSDSRKRYWDSERGIWYWKIEDVEDADTPNINQLDIPIQPNEKVEIRIKSISEVGWPETPVESDWSDILTVEFPDDLNNILNESEFILKEASQDESLVNMESALNSRGVYRHIQDSFYVNELYYAHVDKNIQSSFLDSNGNYLNIYDYLKTLTDRIKTLEDQINKAKGEFSVILHTPLTSFPIKSTQSYNLIVELEDYAEKSGTTRQYFNNVGLIDDYYLEIKNIGSSPLSLLSNRKYESTSVDPNNTFYKFESDKALTVNYNSDLYTQFDNQWIWFSDNSGGNSIYSGVTSYNESTVQQILSSKHYNLGWGGDVSSNYFDAKFNIISTEKSGDSGITWYDDGLPSGSCMATVYPLIYNTSDIVELNQNKLRLLNGNSSEIIKIHIYYKLDGSKEDDDIYIVSNPRKILYRKLKVFIEPDTLAKPFEFELNFIIRQFKLVLTSNAGQSQTNNNTQIN